ncbi:DNA recombination protein RmuC [Candidatus Uhrbacteria bacterium]|nr:DNA recombination protein RmuC [Candidatus Uhrbacteria bacterium]
MLNTILLIIAVIALGGLIAIAVGLTFRLKELRDTQTNDKTMLMLNQNLNSVNEKIDQTNRDINDRLTRAAEVIGRVQKELGTVQERFKGFEEFSDLLHPKMRGNFGEEILEDMLSQSFSPEHYQMQYRFGDNATVDAVIKTRGGIIPIDSKFPRENFQQMYRAENDSDRKAKAKEFAKAVRKHIDDIARKYILPEQGTVNFAVMYIPSENIYYHILTEEEADIMDYAKKKSVFLVSPQSFFGLIRVIFLGMERSRIQEQAQRILDILKGIQQEAGRFGENLNLVSKHVNNAKGAMDTATVNYGRLTGKLDQISLMGDGDCKKIDREPAGETGPEN